MERNKIVVPDASVIVKWFVEEEYTHEANQLRRDYVNQFIEIMVPNIIYYEVVNALRYSGVYGEDELIQVGEALQAYQFLEIPLKGEYLKETVKRALKHGITIYDACYVAIASIEKAILYTADEKLIDKINEPTLIKHIKEYKPVQPK